MGQGRPPRIIKKPLVSKKEVKMQHKDRVNKMKALYGLNEAQKEKSPESEAFITSNEFPYNKRNSTTKVFDYEEESIDQLSKSLKQIPNNINVAKVLPSNKQIARETHANSSNTTESAPTGPSLYSFYQNIIDKNNEGSTSKDIKSKMSHPKYQVHSTKPSLEPQPNPSPQSDKAMKESPSLAQKSSKFKNAGRDIVHKSPHESIGKAEGLADNRGDKLHDIIEEDIDPSHRESVPEQTYHWAPKDHSSPEMRKTAKGNGFDESDGDGLINWALNLPDEFNGSQSSQFYKHSS